MFAIKRILASHLLFVKRRNKMSIDTNDEKSKLFMYMVVFLIYCAGRISLQYCIYG